MRASSSDVTHRPFSEITARRGHGLPLLVGRAGLPRPKTHLYTLSERQQAHIGRLAEHPRVRNACQLGTIAALDLVAGDAGYLSRLAPRLLAHFNANDVLLRPLGNTIYVMPPYCIEDAELTRVYAVIVEA